MHYYKKTYTKKLHRSPAAQSLLLALGVKANRVGPAAAGGWVWANAVGKLGKTAFAAKATNDEMTVTD